MLQPQLQLADRVHHHREIRDATVNLCPKCDQHGDRALGLDGKHESLALGVMRSAVDVAALTKRHAK
jgi:hypothetical protein